MKKKLPKFLGYFGHMLLSYASSWSDVNNVRLVQKTKRESPKMVTNNVQMFLLACLCILCDAESNGERV